MKYSIPFFALSSLLILSGCTNPFATSEPITNNEAPDDVVYDESVEYPEYDSVEVVTEDAYGKDFDFAPRYPDSLRSYYEAYTDETTVTYQTTDSSDEVRAYYAQYLQDNGWKLEGDGTDFSEYSREEEAGTAYLSLYFYDYSTEQDILEYELYYEAPINSEASIDLIEE